MRTTSLFHLTAWLSRLGSCVTANTSLWLLAMLEMPLDHRTGDPIVRDCCWLLPFSERPTCVLRLLHETLAVSAIVLGVAIVQAVEALFVLVLLCPLLGLVFLFASMSSRLSLPLTTLLFLPLPVTAPICMGATPPAASLTLAISCTSPLTLENVSSLLACVTKWCRNVSPCMCNVTNPHVTPS